MCIYDIDGDNQLELAVGWTNGKLDFRSIATGEVLLKEQMQSSIAGLTIGDYRLDGTTQLIACAVDGQGFIVRLIHMTNIIVFSCWLFGAECRWQYCAYRSESGYSTRIWH